MTIAEYLEYEKKVNKNHISDTKSYLPAYLGKSTPTYDPIREFASYFGPNQPGAESDCDSEDMEEEVEYMTDDEIVMSEQEGSNHGYTQNNQHFEEKDDVDKWLNAEITKHMSMQGVENMKDALISIIKSIRQEMKDGIIKRQFEASIASVSDEVSSIASNEVDRADDNTPNTALYAKDNIMPQRVYEYLGLDKLRDTSTLENTTGTNEPLGTVNIIVKFGELEFPCNFIIKMAKDVIILGKPFLESTRAQIDVFNEEISFEIGIRYGRQNIDDTTREQSYDVEEEYAREIGNPYSKIFDEYNRMFNNEIGHLSNEYILRIGKKGYVLDDVWEKCQQNYRKTNEAWHDEAYEEEEMWRIRDEKTEYDPPYVNIKTFEVKKYSFKGGRSFICITDREDEAPPLGRVNGA
ncbi:phospholipase-like protein [Tanacetum coccineum]